MASTFSPSLRIELIGNGDQSGVWGQTTNSNLGTLVEQAITGVISITMANANYVLTNFNGVTDEARNAVIVVNGTNGAVRQVVAPLANKTYLVKNNTIGGYAVTFGGATGTTVPVPNGVTLQVYCDGTNFYEGANGSASNFDVIGDLSVSGTTALAGNLTAPTATFSGAISSVSPSFTGVPTAPTAAAGTNTTQIATTAFALANGVPTGALSMWPTAAAPTGYLLCTGGLVSRTTYAALFAVIGTTFGAGDGSTTFSLPDYRNRFPVGAGSTYNVAATGGSADAVTVAHTHTASSAVTDPGHNHSLPIQNFPGNGFISGGGNAWGTGSGNTGSAVTSITVATTVASAGVSGTNANLPPYLGIYFIIKA